MRNDKHLILHKNVSMAEEPPLILCRFLGLRHIYSKEETTMEGFVETNDRISQVIQRLWDLENKYEDLQLQFDIVADKLYDLQKKQQLHEGLGDICPHTGRN